MSCEKIMWKLAAYFSNFPYLSKVIKLHVTLDSFRRHQNHNKVAKLGLDPLWMNLCKRVISRDFPTKTEIVSAGLCNNSLQKRQSLSEGLVANCISWSDCVLGCLVESSKKWVGAVEESNNCINLIQGFVPHKGSRTAYQSGYNQT